MTFRASVEKYFKAIASQYRRGDAREESYYDALKQLWEELGSQLSNPHAKLTVLPRQTEAGNPDMRVWSDEHHVTGYIEAKDPKEANLDRVEVSEQLKRYCAAFPNVILTNFLEFRLYRSGQLMGQPVIIASLQALQAGMNVPFQHEEQFRELVERFFDFQLPRIYTAQTLAVALADRTRYLQQQVLAQLVDDEDHKLNSELVNLLAEFKQMLMSDLTSDTFADLYAQTITYGMFAARMRVTGTFTRETALNGIPATIGILRKLFKYISIGDTPERLRVIIDDIADVLAVADTDKVFKGFDKNGRDPVADFYETFLGEYDPAKKKQHGVYYTPQPVVSYIVRSVDQILRDSFGKPDGLADPSVTVLDPAAGTMTFPATAVRLAAETYKAKYGDGSLDNWVREHVLQHFFAFELMIAAYTVGHLRISMVLADIGYSRGDNDRFQLYITNTLENTAIAHTKLQERPIPGMSPLADERTAADDIKNRERILVIMGNPPYSGTSSNKGAWITGLIDDYKVVDGKPLGEKNPKWLQDDYVKFIRFAQWKIDQAGEGVLGFITNHGYLDNSTFRGMRRSLMTSFDQLHILNLHGNSHRNEKAPDGSKDENVFWGIEQGVSIVLAVKRHSIPKGVWYGDLWGDRDAKFRVLGSEQMTQTAWQELNPRSDTYLFVPQDTALAEEYEQWPKVTEIFPVGSVGVVTARDDFAVGFDTSVLKNRLEMFFNSDVRDEELKESLGLEDTGTWRLARAREEIRKDPYRMESVVPILYRPFDMRWFIYHDAIIERARRDVMSQLLPASRNLAIVVPRRVETKGDWQHCFIADVPVDHVAVSLKTIDTVLPLFRFSPDEGSTKQKGSIRTADAWVGSPNVDRTIWDNLGSDLGFKPTPEQLIGYVYAVLYAPAYRKRYAQFLKADFPRIPFTKDRDTFRKLADLGQQLIDLHLMRSPELDNPISRFCGKGDGAVTKVEYDPDRGRVTINPTQYFDGVIPDLWAYQIGGYQVLAKWLKDRKGRFLTSADTIHYSRIVTALARTSNLQRTIDPIAAEVLHEGGA